MKSLFRNVLGLVFLVGAALTTNGCSEQPLAPEDLGSEEAVIAAGERADASGSGSANELRLEVDLAATAANRLADGTAKFESREGRRKFSTEVEDVAVNGTGRVAVLRDGVRLLNRPIEIANGFGDLNLDTQNGQAVPVLRAGDLVKVFNANGRLILQGRLAVVQ